jgi:excisionase family DNA binding protein
MIKKTQTQVYLTSSEAADLLGLSIGTVQKMTKNGLLTSHPSPGGHRRILSTSINQFFNVRGIKYPPLETEENLICIMHNSTIKSAELESISKLANVKVISHPLEIIGIQKNISTLFIDARSAWLDDAIFRQNTELTAQAKFVVYNSTALPTKSSLRVNPSVSTFEGDINSQFIYGYLLKNTYSPAMKSALS